MSAKLLLIASVILAATLLIDVSLITNGALILGIFSIVGTVLVFASSLFWQVRIADKSVHLRNKWLIIPLISFCVGVGAILQRLPTHAAAASEDLPEIGYLMVTRYQTGLWIVGLIILANLVMASSLMEKS